jgi:hypothetical protein
MLSINRRPVQNPNKQSGTCNVVQKIEAGYRFEPTTYEFESVATASTTEPPPKKRIFAYFLAIERKKIEN